ncbi:MAG TPA: hypothetical protein VK306_01710 [Acidimicrobiales bacterium]|nr:hypothetical protein [Acidimicrobiales bacterium]
MRFKLGLAVGFAAGYWYGSLSEEERKRQLDEALAKVRSNPRVQQVTETVSRNAGKVGEAVGGRTADTVDTATDTVASTVAPSDPGTGASRSSRSSRSSSVADAEAAGNLPGSGIG